MSENRNDDPQGTGGRIGDLPASDKELGDTGGGSGARGGGQPTPEATQPSPDGGAAQPSPGDWIPLPNAGQPSPGGDALRSPSPGDPEDPEG